MGNGVNAFGDTVMRMAPVFTFALFAVAYLDFGMVSSIKK